METFTNDRPQAAQQWQYEHRSDGYVLVRHGRRRTLHSSPQCIHLRPWKNHPTWRLIAESWDCSTDVEELRSKAEQETGRDPYRCRDCGHERT